MTDFPSLLYTAKDKIIVLSPVIFPPESAHFSDKFFSNHKKMGNIIIGAEQIQIKVRLKMRLKVFSQISCHLVLIRIEDVNLLFFQPFHHPVQSLGSQQIIMIQKPHKSSRSHKKCFIGVLRNSKILIQILHMNPLIHLYISLKNFCHLLIFRTCIGNTQLPEWIRLAPNGFYHLL